MNSVRHVFEIPSIYYFFTKKEIAVNINLSLAPLVALVAGILILIMPRLLNYIVAIYLIIIGVIGLFGAGNLLK